MSDLTAILAASGLIPLIEAERPETGVAIARALHLAGLPLVEVVQRTAASRDCLRAIATEVPGLVIGAGTVLSPRQALDCLAAGARFIVSPGLDAAIVGAVRDQGADVIPGVMTPTEIQQALAQGLETLKFFPAEAAGGIATLTALASVFRAVRFVPTGGISATNLGAWLGHPAVLACGGSWMTPGEAIARGDFARITTLAAEALAIAGRALALRADRNAGSAAGVGVLTTANAGTSSNAGVSVGTGTGIAPDEPPA